MAKCGLCEKTIYTTTTEKGFVFDSHCISCRGLFNLYTYRGMTEQQAKDTITECYSPVNPYKALPAKGKHSVITDKENFKKAKQRLALLVTLGRMLSF